MDLTSFISTLQNITSEDGIKGILIFILKSQFLWINIIIPFLVSRLWAFNFKRILEKNNVSGKYTPAEYAEEFGNRNLVLMILTALSYTLIYKMLSETLGLILVILMGITFIGYNITVIVKLKHLIR